MKKYKDFQINSSLGNYELVFTEIGELINWQPGGDFLIVDSFLKGKIKESNQSNIFWIKSNEKAKSFTELNKIFIALKLAKLSKDSILYAIGGGVVQDIATFVSSLYMRGINWNYIPTTFLGMTDSCIGGKSSINIDSYKNLIGNFYPPKKIILISSFTKSLPFIELIGGLVESAKISFCKGNISFKNYLKLTEPILKRNWSDSDINNILYETLKIKKWFIEKDEFDKSERRLLNYGHTWGHAVESATDFMIPHGHAVAMGMMASIQFSKNPSSFQNLWDHCLELTTSSLQKKHFTTISKNKFLLAFESDKKHSLDHYHLILPIFSEIDELGVKEIKFEKNKKVLQEIWVAMEKTFKIIKKNIFE